MTIISFILKSKNKCESMQLKSETRSIFKRAKKFSGAVVLQKIISGGQTGVDRAALDIALEYNFPCGGWCPAKRRAEDGSIPVKYPLIEMPTTSYLARTRRNVEDSDGTLIITHGLPTDGTKKTIDWACKFLKPYLIIDLEKHTHRVATLSICQWLKTSHIRILNIAGPRESKCPGISDEASQLISSVLDHLNIK